MQSKMNAIEKLGNYNIFRLRAFFAVNKSILTNSNMGNLFLASVLYSLMSLTLKSMMASK